MRRAVVYISVIVGLLQSCKKETGQHQSLYKVITEKTTPNTQTKIAFNTSAYPQMRDSLNGSWAREDKPIDKLTFNTTKLEVANNHGKKTYDYFVQAAPPSKHEKEKYLYGINGTDTLTYKIIAVSPNVLSLQSPKTLMIVNYKR